MALVRPEEPRDRDASLQVERLAFGSDEEPGIVEAVRDEEESFALVAEEDGAVVGHVQFSRAWIGETALLALGPVGVVPDRRGRGIGSELILEGLEEARSRGEAAVILLGDPAFYPRFGFSRVRRSGSRTRSRGCGPTGSRSPKRLHGREARGGSARQRGPLTSGVRRIGCWALERRLDSKVNADVAQW